METRICCIGCGATIQSEQEAEIGFIPKSQLGKEQVLCQRCFKLRHYNKNETVALESEDFIKMVSEIQHTNSLIVHVIDLFDVDGTLLKNLPSLVGHNPIILVGNKVDLLPKSTNKRRLKDWLIRKAKEAGLHIADVFLISATKGHHLDDLAVAMEEMRQHKDIYVVGVTNVGKSTFINRFIDRSIGENDLITTSYFPGTTLGFIEIPLDKQSALIDTPGILNLQQIAHFVSKRDLTIITPKKEIKARNYQLNSAQTLFVGGLLRMDFIKGERQTFICYFANGLPIHRTKLDKADALYEKQVGQLLVPPNNDTLAKGLPPFVKRAFKIKEPYTDIVISGLGWITILQGDVTIEVHCPKGVLVHLRKSFISKQ
jgi:ribosome biogenesis GTPase YqeH